ncbi:MAG: NAD(P)-dependent oxidoreductase [Chloroflexi bacterium]|nr:NAD(P)-dependent oxidoreductase [Chloroflexota bacterium]MCL5109127.1 NAD(P)-dependent oxidoreductase [Chloroflexota bacterium]
MKVGVIGTGTMGGRMVAKFVEGGHEVVARDIAPAAEAKAQAAGAKIVKSPVEVAREADVVILSLPMPADVAEVVAGPDGLLSAARQGQVIVDMSTVDPMSTQKMAKLAGEKGVAYLDAPVLGRPQGCGAWALPVGGDAAALEKARPVLDKVAKRIERVGDSGSGNVVKLLNNLMFGAINAVTAEVMALAAKVDMPPKILFDLIASSGAATVSNLFKELGPKMLARDYSPLFAIDLLWKDNMLALEMAKAYKAPMPLSATMQVLNEMARAKSLGAEDTSALIKVYEELYGVKVEG